MVHAVGEAPGDPAVTAWYSDGHIRVAGPNGELTSSVFVGKAPVSIEIDGFEVKVTMADGRVFFIDGRDGDAVESPGPHMDQ